MGYTHYYTINGWDEAEWQSAWPILTNEVPMIVEAADVLVTGPLDDDSRITPLVADPVRGIWLNGVAEDEHEPFRLSQTVQKEWCKTARKPYDIAVACVLLSAYLLTPGIVKLHSDGDWDRDWKEARHLYIDLWPGESCWCPWDEHDAPQEAILKSTEQNIVIKAPRPSAATYIQAIQAQASTYVDKQGPFSLPISISQCGPTTLHLDETYMKPIRQWLARCEGEASHSNCLPLTIHWPASAGVQFRVIDIHRRCIAVAPENCRYIALSYVWGAVDQPKLTIDVSNELAKEGGLAAIWPKIPQTVRDAIAFCDGLGERYLWVDALCIMQDLPRDMRLSILRMRQIYAAAKCTLGAISANTASAGLSASFRVDALYRVIDSSPWSRRAWCYQEKVLSHRMIFFTSRGLYMQCQSGVYRGAGALLPREDRCPELDRYNTVGGMLSANIGDTNDLQSYLSAVEHYSSRTTTKRTDKMNAFQGILQMYKGVIDGTASTFCVGLPAFAFDLAICWRAEQHNPELRNPAFPSWSWLGWDQAVRFHPAMALEKAHTNQMFAPLNLSKQCDIMKQNGPGFREITELRKPANHINDPNGFGFPASTGQIHCPPSLSLDASIAKLSIASEPKGSKNHSNCYAVYPLPSSGASPPLGYIWLHEQWRAQQDALCIMDFMALSGNPDAERPGNWTITMPMCLKLVKDNGLGGTLNRYERLQVMDCELSEEEWLNMGGVTAGYLELV